MTPVRRTRGLGVKPALEHVSLRVPKEVAFFYRKYAGVPGYTIKMREVLTNYAKRNGG